MSVWILTLLACTATNPDDPPIPEDTGQRPETGEPGLEWTQVSPWPCALATDGIVRCWGSWFPPTPEYVPVPDSVEPVTQFYAPPWSRTAWGRTPNGTNHVWHCRIGVPDSTPPFPCDPPTLEDPVALGYECAHERTGEIRCVGDQYSTEQPLVARLADVAADPIAWLEHDGRLVVKTPFATSLDMHLPDHATVEQLSQLGGGACVRHTDGDVHCYGTLAGETPTSLFPNPPYRDLQGNRESICATRHDWTLECNDGQTYDHGPYRDLEVTSSYFTTGAEPVPIEDRLAFCLITVDNDIYCHGRRYERMEMDMPVDTTQVP